MPDDDFARYEQEDAEPIDYRHRMLMNVISVAIVSLLVGTGVWITDTIAAMEKDQDCLLQGRANCAPIEIPAMKQQ
jgi:fructose-specific component phosphotransferase system IIB-like protein